MIKILAELEINRYPFSQLIMCSLHVFTNPESMNPNLFSIELLYVLICSKWFFISHDTNNNKWTIQDLYFQNS